MNETINWLTALHYEHENSYLEMKGKCHDCCQPVTVLSTMHEGDEINVTGGGAIYKVEGIETPFFKCDVCFEKDSTLRNYQPCEVWSRVVGYLRPVKQYNKGKQEEWKMRKNFVVED